jgi:hypothetical protein
MYVYSYTYMLCYSRPLSRKFGCVGVDPNKVFAQACPHEVRLAMLWRATQLRLRLPYMYMGTVSMVQAMVMPPMVKKQSRTPWMAIQLLGFSSQYMCAKLFRGGERRQREDGTKETYLM